MVPERGLEPPRDCSHMVLNHACLPFHHSGTPPSAPGRRGSYLMAEGSVNCRAKSVSSEIGGHVVASKTPLSTCPPISAAASLAMASSCQTGDSCVAALGRLSPRSRSTMVSGAERVAIARRPGEDMVGTPRAWEETFQLCGWSLFVASAGLFVASSIRSGDMLGLLGSLVFLFACVVFRIPLVAKRIARPSK